MTGEAEVCGGICGDNRFEVIDAAWCTREIDLMSREMRDYARVVKNATDGCSPDVAENTAVGIREFAERLEDLSKKLGSYEHKTTGNDAKMRKALTDLVEYLNKAVESTSKCNGCEYNGKSFRGEPCYWHVDCGIEEYDKKASNNASYLLKKFKLQKILSAPPRNCDLFPDWEEAYFKWVRDVQEVNPYYIFDIENNAHERVEDLWGQFSPDQNREFIDWYMSPAEVKEGVK